MKASIRFLVLIAAAAIWIGPASAQPRSTAEQYADWYVYQCSLITGNDRYACYSLLPWRIPGYKPHPSDPTYVRGR